MKRTRQERIRLGIMFVSVVLFFVVIVLRLGQLQLSNGSEYAAIVERQSSGKIAIPAERGLIYDRYGRLLAKNVTRNALYAHPESNLELDSVASYLEQLFDLPQGEAVNRYRLSRNRFRWIERRLDDRLADQIASGAPRGLYLRCETSREYPFGRVGKQILGYTNIDNQGLSGFELSHDSLLTGASGWADIRRDGHRNTLRVKEQALVKPVPGRSVVLTVDWQFQEIVEQELRQAVEQYQALSGMAVFLNCNTGEVLAMTHYDPEEKHPNRPTKLRAVSDQFEPGSAFKAFTAAALLDAGQVDFSDSIFCEMGRWKIGRRTLHDDKELGWLSFRQVIEKSSNIGLGKWTTRLDGKVLMETYRKFGFGRKSGLGFPGETKGRLVEPETWSDYNIAAMAMGHSVATSALQMANAMATVANGGNFFGPRLVLGSVDKKGCVVEHSDPVPVQRALKETSADSLRAFLRGVVECGTGQPVNSEFVSIAGKTGTAEIPNLEAGGYHKNKFMASFCGFFPAGSPIVAGIVVLREPHPVTYGGHTSGVTFRQIAERYAISNPDLLAVAEQVCVEKKNELNITVAAPNFVGHDVLAAGRLADERSVSLRSEAEIGIVTWQWPAPGRVMLIDDEVLVTVRSESDDGARMIDLSGMTIRKASAFLSHVGIKYTVEGTGRVTRQSVRPGEPLTSDLVCRLQCQPTSRGRES